MSDDGAPKSAYELAMARLRQQDKQEGREDRPLSDEQRAKIAEIRNFYAAKLAEREILHQSALARAGGEAEAMEKLEEEYRRDRDRLTGERDRKLEELRRG
jgi:hypothetical protein